MATPKTIPIPIPFPIIRKPQYVAEWTEGVDLIAPIPKVDWIKNKQLDLPYGSDPKQKFDFYYPEEGNGPFPLYVIVHGGGFTHLDKRDYHLYSGFFALQEGFAVASVNYRLAPEHKYPAAIDDVNAALRYLSDHASGLNIDADNVFLVGTSAGGNLVTIAGLENGAHRAGIAIPDFSGDSELSDLHIRAVAALCPAVNIKSWSKIMDRQSLAPMRPAVRNMLKQYLGATPGKVPELAEKASAGMYITKAAPAFYLQHGSLDPLIPADQSIAFADVLREEAGLGEEDLVLDILKGALHAGEGTDFFEEENIMHVIDFFKRHVK